MLCEVSPCTGVSQPPPQPRGTGTQHARGWSQQVPKLAPTPSLGRLLLPRGGGGGGEGMVRLPPERRVCCRSSARGCYCGADGPVAQGLTWLVEKGRDRK